MTQGSPAWQQTAAMAYPRTHLNLTVLPDGNVLATGGLDRHRRDQPGRPGSSPAELWNPATRTWSTWPAWPAPASTTRPPCSCRTAGC